MTRQTHSCKAYESNRRRFVARQGINKHAPLKTEAVFSVEYMLKGHKAIKKVVRALK
jgi:hypothetical protein